MVDLAAGRRVVGLSRLELQRMDREIVPTSRKDKVISLYNRNFNCCQVVFAAYRPLDKIDEETALTLASMFGGGVACSGTGPCGAMMGGLMAISMHLGNAKASPVEQAKVHEAGKAFMADFAAIVGSTNCEGVLGINIGTRENLKKARNQKLFEAKCLHAVNAAAELLDKIL